MNQVRNLLAAVGSDDEDEDFGALFSQLARSNLIRAYLLNAKESSDDHEKSKTSCLQHAGTIFKSAARGQKSLCRAGSSSYLSL